MIVRMGVGHCPQRDCDGKMYPLSILNNDTGHFVCINHDKPYHEVWTSGSVKQFWRHLEEKEINSLTMVQERYETFNRKLLFFLRNVK